MLTPWRIHGISNEVYTGFFIILFIYWLLLRKKLHIKKAFIYSRVIRNKKKVENLYLTIEIFGQK